MDYNGKDLYIGQGNADKIIRFVVNGIPIYHFSHYSNKSETVDFYGHTLSVKFDKRDNILTESAQKALDKLKKKGTRWELRGDSLKQIFSQFAIRRDQPKTLTNYVDVMEESYDKCERLTQYGDNTILQHNGRYGMDYQDLGFALYCEYDTIAPIAGHKGIFAIKRAGKWGIANEFGLTAKCCYDSIRMENNGDVVLVVKPKYTLFNGITKKEACYEETINSLGYPEFANLQELLTSNVVKKKKDDVIDNFFPLAKLGESIHRYDIVAMTYCIESYMESMRGNKQKSQLIMNLAKSYTPSIKLIEDICMQWWEPVRDAYWAEKNARLQRFNQKLERMNRVLDKVIAVMQPLAQASPTAKVKTNTYSTPMASRKTSSGTTSVRNGSAANDILKRKQVLKAKQKYSFYIDLVDSYVSLASDLYARIKANKVMAYGSSERRELSEHKQKIKNYLDECVKWRKVAADNGGNITASTIESKAREILSLKE